MNGLGGLKEAWPLEPTLPEGRRPMTGNRHLYGRAYALDDRCILTEGHLVVLSMDSCIRRMVTGVEVAIDFASDKATVTEAYYYPRNYACTRL